MILAKPVNAGCVGWLSDGGGKEKPRFEDQGFNLWQRLKVKNQ
jgi:hypothetical protein